MVGLPMAWAGAATAAIPMATRSGHSSLSTFMRFLPSVRDAVTMSGRPALGRKTPGSAVVPRAVSAGFTGREGAGRPGGVRLSREEGGRREPSPLRGPAPLADQGGHGPGPVVARIGRIAGGGPDHDDMGRAARVGR